MKTTGVAGVWSWCLQEDMGHLKCKEEYPITPARWEKTLERLDFLRRGN
jgi:hypothetical protein